MGTNLFPVVTQILRKARVSAIRDKAEEGVPVRDIFAMAEHLTQNWVQPKDGNADQSCFVVMKSASAISFRHRTLSYA